MLLIRRVLPNNDAHPLERIHLHQVRLTDLPLGERRLNQGESERGLDVEREASLLYQSHAFLGGEEVVVGCCGHLFVVQLYGYWVCRTLEYGPLFRVLYLQHNVCIPRKERQNCTYCDT